MCAAGGVKPVRLEKAIPAMARGADETGNDRSQSSFWVSVLTTDFLFRKKSGAIWEGLPVKCVLWLGNPRGLGCQTRGMIRCETSQLNCYEKVNGGEKPGKGMRHIPFTNSSLLRAKWIVIYSLLSLSGNSRRNPYMGPLSIPFLGIHSLCIVSSDEGKYEKHMES